MTQLLTLSFDQPDLLEEIDTLTDSELDDLAFGVIGFDAKTIVQRYNTYESQAAALSSKSVIGHPLFTVVAPCMNNFLVAERFAEAPAATALDATIDYVLTLRMRPTKVKLRLLAAHGHDLRYVLVSRRP